MELDQLLHLLNPIQRKWAYLEPIFGNGALPKEQQRFNRIDSDFKFVSTKYFLMTNIIPLHGYFFESFLFYLP